MTGYDALKRTLQLLGYSGESGDPAVSQAAAQRGLAVINQISADLRCGGIVSLSDTLRLPASKEEALCYGAAMLLALTYGDPNKNRLFAEIYNAKRAAVLAEIGHISDCLPKGTAG